MYIYTCLLYTSDAADDKKAQQPISPPGAETGYGPLQDLSKITKKYEQTNKQTR